MDDISRNAFLARFVKMTYATRDDLYAVPYLDYQHANGNYHMLLLCDMPLQIMQQDDEYCVVAAGWAISEHRPGCYDVLNEKPHSDCCIWPEDYLAFHYKDYVLIRNSGMSPVEFVDKAEPVRRLAYTEQIIDML